MSSAAQPDVIEDPPSIRPTIERHLGLWDSVSIIIGIVVGTAIFRSPTVVFQNVTGPFMGVFVWLLGGLLCMLGGMIYAELATTYPRNGGDYEYLSRAYGRLTGFLFGWAQLTVVLTGSIGAMAYTFADYGTQLWGFSPAWAAWIACGVILLLSVLNVLGIAVGKNVQNLLSVAKVIGLCGVVVAAIIWGNTGQFTGPSTASGLAGPGLGMALVFVLYAFGGWSDASFVAAEVKDPHRNLPRAMMLGIGGITLIYLAIVSSYVAVLGFEGARETVTPAADVMQAAVGGWGRRIISVLVMISALGAINGMILTGSRIYATVGEDHHFFAWLGQWSRSAAPVAAILVQAAISLLLVLAVGTDGGRDLLDRLVGLWGSEGLPWAAYYGGFDTLVAGTAPVFWTFFLLTSLSVFRLRRIDPDRIRPFPAPLFPLPAFIFTTTCAYMLYSSLTYARWLSLIGIVPLVLGLPFYALRRRHTSFKG